MSILYAVILGIVQGLAEFFPISSSGHLGIMSGLFNLLNNEALFEVMLHFGTLIAIIIFFWQDIRDMILEAGAMFNVGPLAGKPKASYPYARQLLMIVAATLPLFLVLAFHERISLLRSNSVFVGAMLILMGCALFVSDKMQRGSKNENNISFFDALIIGLCQCVGVIPGISRIGVATAAGVANGLSNDYALKFAMLISLPALLGDNILGLVDALTTGFDLNSLPAYIVGMGVSVAAGIIGIVLMRHIFNKGKFGGFSYYCWLAGALSIVLTMIF